MATPENGPQTVMILGATSAMARATAAEFARAGYQLILGARNQEENQIIAADLRTRHGGQCTALAFDALDFDLHGAFLKHCAEAAGAWPDGLVVFFGYMTEQERAQQDFSAARQTIDANLTAVVSVVEQFAARCEERRSGFIGVVSSVAGDRGRQSNYIYGASKAGLTAYLAGLRNRLFKANVSVTTIKPGFVDTKMTYGLPLPQPLVATPEAAGKAIYRAIARRKDVVYVPFFWRYIMLLIKSIPEWQFKKMKL
ncbi:MAG: SDR family oxidoreductase [Candidatus Hydrogenedentes bacterium]|nr:SDR family oxidoreductase [Candidatus Hydrogenedentota bacterium]